MHPDITVTFPGVLDRSRQDLSVFVSCDVIGAYAVENMKEGISVFHPRFVMVVGIGVFIILSRAVCCVVCCLDFTVEGPLAGLFSPKVAAANPSPNAVTHVTPSFHLKTSLYFRTSNSGSQGSKRRPPPQQKIPRILGGFVQQRERGFATGARMKRTVTKT